MPDVGGITGGTPTVYISDISKSGVVTLKFNQPMQFDADAISDAAIGRRLKEKELHPGIIVSYLPGYSVEDEGYSKNKGNTVWELLKADINHVYI